MSLQDNSTRPIQIVSGAPTVTFTSPNLFTLQMPASGYRTGKDEVCLKSLTLYYSWSNISAEKNNNTFSYVWPGAGAFPVTLADGIWSFADILSYLQLVMFSNGHYLVLDGSPVYYISLVVNPTLYCLSLTCSPLPTVLPVGFSNPANVDLFGAAGQTPQLVIPASVSKLTGFAAGIYPSTATTAIYQINSGIPQISDVTSLNLLSNLPDNSGFSLNARVLASFVKPEGQLPGSLMTIQPFNVDWVRVQEQQTFQTITLELVDQLFRPVTIRDPSGMVAILNVRKRG
jgi:hypothetical protein